VNDALPVRRFQRLGDLLRDRQRFCERHGPARDALRQVLPLNELHHEGAHPAGFFEAVNVRDIGMVQRRESLRFACEARQPIGIGGEGVGQHLQCDVAIEPGVARAEHLAHAAFAKLGDDIVDPQTGAGGERHTRRIIRGVRAQR
jgi:hypothetical protein